MGGLAVIVVMDSDKQIEVIHSSLPQEYKMEYVKNCIQVNLHYTTLHNNKPRNKRIANGGHLQHNSKQQPFTVVESFVNPCIK